MTNLGREFAEPTPLEPGEGSVLLIAADVDEAAILLGKLGAVTEESLRVEWVTSLQDGVERLRDGGVAATVLDLSLPGSETNESLDTLFRAASDVPILILSETSTEAAARQAVRNGAHNYLLKEEADGSELRRAVRRMVYRHAAETVAIKIEIANAILDSIGEAVLTTDKLGGVTYLNLFAEKMTGWSRKEATGRPVGEVLRLVDSATGEAVDNGVAKVMQGDWKRNAEVSTLHCTLVRRDGVEFGIECRVTIVTDRTGRQNGAVMAIRDVSKALAVSLEASRVAQHDVLTNLPNRALFYDRLRQAVSLAERQHKQLSVLFIDLDQFKRINDSLGHAVGDKLLQSVSARLTACVRRTDTVCRLGGDEFVILLSQIEHAEDAEVCARKLLRAIASPHNIDNRSLDVSVSIGGSVYPDDAPDAEALMMHADAAMYEAKLHGRNGYEFFRSDMRVRIASRLLLERDLRYALGGHQFLLHYQPKVNLDTGRITGMEALIRWQHPEHGLLLPESFISIAEECGLIVSIGQWVLLEACHQSRAWNDAGLGAMPIAVNVSAAEFRAKDFLSCVRAVLIATGVEPGNLELEITETVLMEDAESTLITLQNLKAMGVQIAIDDFGTGYSSFSYLQRFPVDTMKVDKSFVQEVTSDPDGINLVSAMIGIGKSLKQHVIAEGVENQSQLDYLQQHGCTEAQGFLFSPPLPAELAERLFGTVLGRPASAALPV